MNHLQVAKILLSNICMLLNLEGKYQFGCSFVPKKRKMRDLLETSDVECGPTIIIITQKRYVVRRNKYWSIPLNDQMRQIHPNVIYEEWVWRTWQMADNHTYSSTVASPICFSNRSKMLLCKMKQSIWLYYYYKQCVIIRDGKEKQSI